MNIVFSSDDNYAPYLCVAILSLLKTNQSPNIKFSILDLGISSESKIFIENIVEQYDHKIIFIPIAKNDFVNLPQTVNYISIATYARFLIAKYLSKEEKALYLDIDIIVNQDLQALYNTDLGDNYIGACIDPFIEIGMPEYKKYLGLNSDNYYFNAGVLLINIKKWKTINVLEEAILWFENNREIKYQDQCILNGLFKDKVLYLNTRYNFTRNSRNRIKESIKKKIPLPKVEQTQMPVAIYHYVGGRKAWHSKSVDLKSRKFMAYFNSLENKPASWNKKIEHISIYKKLVRIMKELVYKYRYNIY
ncbi:glycosyltransferase family 8 protein [Pasteurella atlantica]|uniref:Glycosyltransferase family 8 protein n=2 Tax=Pasteurellaceae TaxID=712 RepID=A0ACC6HMF3_9PAST|nr:glycosyltransferase family 8 protein [Pasteurella atlantica]MDP8052003.1 glycosyltransferase family 8 protein [Pasteurella atlantica]MDP8101382.1 glycosyltransferase family 8 protein [Pasteurella atlantica]MDP8105478.1 glycosyltransferase family 8 protein [Pasteurella atlantica]MDP8148811.1 glycosyltransferase family 8 protein [Pasteurella atlantica]